MDHIVLDLEWNQPRLGQELITEPVVFDSEIIEIGAVKINEDGQVLSEFRSFVKPVFYPALNGRVAQLTHITSGHIAAAPEFPAAFDAFCDWCGQSFALMTWGPTDIPVLMDNMIMHGIPTDPMPVCYDLQRIFSRELMRDQGQCSLEKAMSSLQLTAQRAHDALNDAINTAKICKFINFDTFLDTYQLIYADYRQLSLPQELTDTQELSRRTAFCCPYCGETLTPEDWVHGSAYARCREGDEFYITTSVPLRRDNCVFLKETVMEMNDDFWDVYQTSLNAAGQGSAEK